MPAPRVASVFAPGQISDAREQWRITFTPDGETAYFGVSDAFFPFTRKATIYLSHRSADGWTVPVVAPFSGVHSDIDPFITRDGQRMYFSSIRPVDGVTRGDVDVYMMERLGKGWGTPERLGPEVNSDGDELYPSLSRDGTLYVASGPRAPTPGQHFDIFRAERRGDGFATRVALGAGVNRRPQAGEPNPQDAWEFNPEISPDGSLLIFTSLRSGGMGLGDLYASRLVNGEWTAASNLGPAVNSPADEYHPTYSSDGAMLYFVRRSGRDGDFFRIATSSLSVLAPGGRP